MVKICAYAICGDEPLQFVKRWLRAVSYADYIVVHCTTNMSKATKFLLRVKNLFQGKLIVNSICYLDWRFDVPRNYSLKMIPEDVDVCFCSDIDEVVIPEFFTDVRSAVEKMPNFKHIWYRFASDNVVDNNTVHVNRWFWNNKCHQRFGWKWQFPVHETLTTTRDDYSGDIYLDKNKIYLFHFPTDKPRTDYLPLLELRLKENPTEIFSLFYLIREYWFNNKAIEGLNICNKLLYELDVNQKPHDNYMSTALYIYMGKFYDALHQQELSISCYKKAVEEYPEVLDGYVALVQALVYQGRINEAKHFWEHAQCHANFELNDWKLFSHYHSEWKMLQIDADIAAWSNDYESAYSKISKAVEQAVKTKQIWYAKQEYLWEDYRFIKNKAHVD